MIVGKGGLTFPKRSPQRLLMGIADREIVAFWSLADSNNKKKLPEAMGFEELSLLINGGFRLISSNYLDA